MLCFWSRHCTSAWCKVVSSRFSQNFLHMHFDCLLSLKNWQMSRGQTWTHRPDLCLSGCISVTQWVCFPTPWYSKGWHERPVRGAMVRDIQDEPTKPPLQWSFSWQHKKRSVSSATRVHVCALALGNCWSGKPWGNITRRRQHGGERYDWTAIPRESSPIRYTCPSSFKEAVRAMRVSELV